MNCRAVALSALALAAAGCTTLVPRNAAAPLVVTAKDWPARRVQLLALQDFALHARIAIAAGSDGFSGTLRWQQHGSAGQMQLVGALGIGAIDIAFDGDSMQLKDSRGNVLADAAARAEIDRRLGFNLPLAELGYWVRGVADPAAGTAREEYVADGTHLAALEQSGWRVEYASEALSPLGPLPQKLSAHRADYRLRLAVDRWSRP